MNISFIELASLSEGANDGQGILAHCRGLLLQVNKPQTAYIYTIKDTRKVQDTSKQINSRNKSKGEEEIQYPSWHEIYFPCTAKVVDWAAKELMLRQKYLCARAIELLATCHTVVICR